MFDQIKNLGDLTKMMGNIGQMRAEMEKMQEEIARKQVTAEAAGGMVQATVNGRLELVKLKIDKTRIDPSDTEMLEDVIVAAVHAAQERAAQMLQQEMRKRAEGMGLPPGMLP